MIFLNNRNYCFKASPDENRQILIHGIFKALLEEFHWTIVSETEIYLSTKTVSEKGISTIVRLCSKKLQLEPTTIQQSHKMSNNDEISKSKPKVGRHRIYSNEQRKDRNRLAQAAFRHRRSNYTKFLEETVTGHEKRIHDVEELSRKSEERAQLAELRCFHLENEVAHLRKLLQIALANNGIQQQAAIMNIPTDNTAVPSPVRDNESIYRSPSSDFCSSESSGSIFSNPEELFNQRPDPCGGGTVSDYQLFIPVATQGFNKIASSNVLLNAGGDNTCSKQIPLITGES
ncbi:hypothetical protein BDF20DRAFT_831723 [Mycotypha africana]|uniref:uncharacterized protein n=1 Tax=Mycotypha africana TaxID=64632 RepID=UPI002301F389|nr:uncharacterized protein BDF20DRAFT_831723 [Mycotypha africana]KAI8991706.1 hypothetical protein BDF20DRAFT_831723 [Mycotypha africana]